MPLFKDILSSEESLFMNTIALDYDYIPKLVPYREQEQRYIAACIKPLLQKRNGKNLLIYGSPGVGKTVAVKHLFKELEEETDDVIAIYVNCWQKNTPHKIILEMCDQLDYKFTHNKNSDELFKILRDMLNKKSVVFCFDEIDKLDDAGILYQISEEIYRKTIILITNFKDWIAGLDERIKSRLTIEMLEFKPYNKAETKGILRHRLDYAFVKGVWDEKAFDLIAEKTAELKDIRTGLYLMRESGNEAENNASRKITVEHVKVAIAKFDDFSIKKSTDLDEDERFILSIIKENSGKKIGELFKLYKEQGGKAGYKTFQRRIGKLEANSFISVKKIVGGPEGSTTIINYEKTKKLTEF
ncbi:AAA family ATPase [Candidatus Woesearchaeota archaeon]|nr:MAG: AAA family ATPase [Candidatus Woesearchaeota archaeon]